MRRKILLLALVISLDACAAFPEVCQVGVPTNKNCFNLQGNKGSFGFGPVNIYTQKF